MKDEWLSSVSRRVRAVHRVPSKETGDSAEALTLQGKSVLPLKGAPYWSPPEHVLEAARRAALENVNAPSAGFRELRRAIADQLEAESAITADPDTQILITNGAMHALSIVFTTLLDPGDEVLMFRPSFFFFGVIELAGGAPVYADTRQESDWRWDGRELERMISRRTKAILLSSPSNPSGYVAGEEALEAVAEVARKNNLLLVSDECYDRMVYDGRRHLRVASLSRAAGRTITICSGTKSYAMQPWRLGFIVAPPALTECFRNVLEWGVLSCSHVAQRAAQAVLNGPQDWIRSVAERFERGRNVMVQELAKARGISFAIPGGGPFLFINTEELGVTGAETSRLLLHEYGVPSDPGTLFGSDHHIRLAFGGPEEVVAEAGRRIVTATQSIAGVGVS